MGARTRKAFLPHDTSRLHSCDQYIRPRHSEDKWRPRSAAVIQWCMCSSPSLKRSLIGDRRSRFCARKWSDPRNRSVSDQPRRSHGETNVDRPSEYYLMPSGEPLATQHMLDCEFIRLGVVSDHGVTIQLQVNFKSSVYLKTHCRDSSHLKHQWSAGGAVNLYS